MADLRFRQVSGASTNAAKIKDNAGAVSSWVIINTNAAARFVKLYDIADPGPTVGTTVPAITIQIAATSMSPFDYSPPVFFKNGIWMATTTGAADSDATAVGAGDLITQIAFE